MIRKYLPLTVILVMYSSALFAQRNQSFEVQSPDGKTNLTVQTGSDIRWSVSHDGQPVIVPSPASLLLEGGEVLGHNVSIRSSEKEEINTAFKPLNYFESEVTDHCNQLTLTCRGSFGIVFRVYNDAVAYRFFTSRKGELVIKNEQANFNFSNDYRTLVPYLTDYRDGRKFNASFESQYKDEIISKFDNDSLAFLPMLVDLGNGEKAVLLEADLEDYPGMFLNLNGTGLGFKGVYAPYPLKEERKGINYIPTERADYIAKTAGTRSFPWRIVVISELDKDLLNNDILEKLASPSRIGDVSWIEAGQVAWDWWNDWNISHVNFKAGINTDTYKYYIDFAADNRIPYIIMDAGWSVPDDLTKTQSAIDLPDIIKHGQERGVGVILWASWYSILQQMDDVFAMYSKMGIKGFKIDFFDRDDQLAVASTYTIAKAAAQYHLMVDYHGIYKPTGLQRTYPNVIGYEGVQGMEYAKWSAHNVPVEDVTIPYLRMMAGPMDYTPGAMRNANRRNFRAINSMPMSQGTRCHQLAMYVIFFAPLQMLSDNPTVYMHEQECTDFITKVPTTFDETVPMDGKVGEYAVLARRKDGIWFAGAMTNWDARDLTLDFSFLPAGKYKMVIFRDGINADRDATDYAREKREISSGDTLNIHLAPGGGWAARVEER